LFAAVLLTSWGSAVVAEQQVVSADARAADAAVMSDFNARVTKYVALHRRLATGTAAQQQTTESGDINAVKVVLAAKMQAARADARQGDIFTPDVRRIFRWVLAAALQGDDGRDARAVIREDAPARGTVTFKVNAPYPDSQPLPSVPAQLLLKLPAVPVPLEYRVVGQHLLLLDRSSDLIVDYILNAVVW
jgi:hypothetical protein